MSKFQNLDPSKQPKTFLDALKWKFFSEKKGGEWPESLPLNHFDAPPEKVEGSKIRVSFVGHATFLIQTASLNILTDPFWSLRASPFTWLGPKRITAPGIPFESLPKIDIVLISHNHYDHLDIPTLQRLWERDKPKIIAPLKNDILLKSKMPGSNVITLDWQDFSKINDSVSIYLEPAQHWSARSLWDRNETLWGTFVIKTPHGSVFFVGDSSYSPTLFKDIGNKFQDIVLSIIPIGAYEPRWFMKDVHMNPEEAVLVHQDVKSKFSIASHFETIKLADDAFGQARKDLAQALEKYHIPENIFITPSIGSAYWFD